MNKVKSAGGAVFQDSETNDGLVTRWLVCTNEEFGHTDLPKGIIEKGETNEDAALREVTEETGVTAQILRELQTKPEYEYEWDGKEWKKVVHFYLMRFESEDSSARDSEMSDVAWVTAEEALKLLTYDSAKEVLAEAIELREEIEPDALVV